MSYLADDGGACVISNLDLSLLIRFIFSEFVVRLFLHS